MIKVKLKKLIDKTTYKFILVGIINTLVGSFVMFLMYNAFHTSYWIASASNYIVGSIVSFFLNKYYTFQNKGKSIKQIIYFIINIVVCYLISYGVAKPVIKFIMGFAGKHTRDNVAMVLGMCIFVCINYLGQRFIVFKEDNTIEKIANNDNESNFH